MFRAIEARLIFHEGGIGTAKIPAEKLKSLYTHIKKVKKNPNDRMLDKSGEFFLKPCVSIMHIVFDFRRVQLVGSIKVYSSHWWVMLGSWSVPGGFWSVLVLVYALPGWRQGVCRTERFFGFFVSL